jgi:hypothetical protein
MNLRDYADTLLTGKSFRIKRTYELESYLIKKTDDIYDKPFTRKNRSWGEVYNATCNMIPEFAIAEQFPDFIKTEFVSGDRHSYAYDLKHKSGDTFEFKRWKNNDNQRWFSYPRDALKTFNKNIDVINYMICGRMKEYQEYYEVGLHLIADAKSFFRYFHESTRLNADPYYNHYFAAEDGNCVFTNVQYEEPGNGIQSRISDRASRVHRLAAQEVTRLSEPQF